MGIGVSVGVGVVMCGGGQGIIWLLVLQSCDTEIAGDDAFAGVGFVRYGMGRGCCSCRYCGHEKSGGQGMKWFLLLGFCRIGSAGDDVAVGVGAVRYGIGRDGVVVGVGVMKNRVGRG